VRDLALRRPQDGGGECEAGECPNERLVLLALWLLVFSASSQIMIVAPILPQIGAELGVSESAQGTLVSAYALVAGVFALVIGPISDSVGRRRVLLAGTGLMSVALLLHAAAGDYVTFLMARALAGVAGGVLSGAAVSYVGDFFPYERRGWASGWVMSSNAAGQVLGVPLGTVAAGLYGIRAPFLLFAATMVFTFLLVWRRLPQPAFSRREAPLTVRGALGEYLELTRRREVLAAALTFCFMFMGLALYVIYLPQWLVTEHGAAPGQIAALFLAGGVASAFTGPAAGRRSDRVGRKKIVILSSLGLAAVMVATPPLVVALWPAYLFFFLAMMFVAARTSPFQALLTALAPEGRRGSLLSLTVAVGQAGFAAGGALAGLVYARAGYAASALAAAVCVLLAGLLVWLFLPEPSRGDAAPARVTRLNPRTKFSPSE
jgi:predicted MFS family arabinose efflux permease